MVDGGSGRWATEEEAKAAAQAAYGAWRAQFRGLPDAPRPNPPEPRRLGFAGEVGLSVRSVLEMLLPIRRRRRSPVVRRDDQADA